MSNKKQSIVGAIAIAIASLVLTNSYALNEAALHQSDELTPNRQQMRTAQEVSARLDRSHYLKKRMDESTSQDILDAYIKSLDSNHTLFLQADIDQFNDKYAKNFAIMLKRGNLTAGYDIYRTYLTRINQYYDFAQQHLDTDVDLHRSDSIIVDREDLPFFTTKAEQQQHWEKQLTLQLINLTIGQQEAKAKDQAFRDNPELAKGQDLILDEDRTPVEILKKRLKRQQERLNRVKGNEILETILNAAAKVYDPHTSYFAPLQAVEMQIQSNLSLEGIGVTIRPDRKNPDYTRIETLVEGGPADKTGMVKPGTFIIGVSDKEGKMVDVVGWSVREVVGLIRGEKGTDVVIRTKEPSQPDSAGKDIVITRDIVEQEEAGVKHRTFQLDYNGSKKRIGVLDIPSFYVNFQAKRKGEDYRSVSADTEKALIALNKKQIDGLVIDLRNNPGGSLDEVSKMLWLFLKEGSLVQIRDNKGNVKVFEDNDGGKQLYSKPLVVLINLASASASEIFAAAIQDYERGLVVGSTTTGKGTAQIQLSNLTLGQMNLTQQKFYRVTGGSTQNKGVIPDIDLINIYDDEVFGERAQDNPMEWDTIKGAPFKRDRQFRDEIDVLTARSQARQASNPQFIYLKTLNELRDEQDNKKPKLLHLEQRYAEMLDIEQRTLEAENARRIATGLAPYESWTVYQAAVDAQAEERSKMKADKRPKLPEDEAFVIEAATILADEINDVAKGIK